MSDRQKQVIQELIQTERNYQNDLLVILQVFFLPLQKSTILSKKNHSDIFSNIENILNLHQDLLQDLESYVNNTKGGPTRHLGAIFLSRIEKFRLYATYCSNQSVATSTLAQMTAINKAFADFLESAFKNPRCRLLPLESFLCLPLQRLCKYPLLIRELIQATSSSSPELEGLHEAWEGFKKTVDMVNEKAREAESFNKVTEIAAKIENFQELQAPRSGRRLFVREGDAVLRKKSSSQKTSHKNFHLFLFSDLLAFSKPTKRGTYSVLHYVHLGPELLLRDVLDCGLNVTDHIGEVYSLVFGSGEMRSVWRSDIDKAIAKLEEEVEGATSLRRPLLNHGALGRMGPITSTSVLVPDMKSSPPSNHLFPNSTHNNDNKLTSILSNPILTFIETRQRSHTLGDRPGLFDDDEAESSSDSSSPYTTRHSPKPQIDSCQNSSSSSTSQMALSDLKSQAKNALDQRECQGPLAEAVNNYLSALERENDSLYQTKVSLLEENMMLRLKIDELSHKSRKKSVFSRTGLTKKG
eukprot:TRINITY_DN7841_c0_g1_i1.p1 TRINITY_DN7841_c0_g1~~TRINITY_DN7841_c0_g1_i1.p1  ORF type:complete len:525 (+),score=118.34 TRINITY_DN7841_c0_g1_i1:68-1642(+)